MRGDIKLYKHQERFVNIYPTKSYMAWETGSGKTIGALATAVHNGYEKLLVVAPRSAHLSWYNDNKHFGLKLDVITYEFFRDKLDDVSKYDLVVFDEAHRLSYTKTQWTKKAIKLRPYMKNILLLSGTPADKYHKLYAQLRILTNGEDEFFKKFPSYTKFVNFFFELDEYLKPKRLKDEQYAVILQAWFHKYADVVKRNDVVELPELSFYDIKLPQTSLEYELSSYDLANFIKEYKTSSLTPQKLEFVLDFIEEDRATVVFSLFKDFVKEAGKKLGNKVYAFTSETPKHMVERAIHLQDKPIITTYILSEGANLQRAYRNIIFASLPLKYIEFEQAIGRIYRAGQGNKVAVYRLLQNEIDYIVKSVIEQKRDIAEYLKEINYVEPIGK